MRCKSLGSTYHILGTLCKKPSSLEKYVMLEKVGRQSKAYPAAGGMDLIIVLMGTQLEYLKGLVGDR